MRPKKLYRTTVVIWTDYEPQMELEDLAREATRGDGYCSDMSTEAVEDPAQMPETEFFDSPIFSPQDPGDGVGSE